jgi:uncharacterized coiled-coil DUF342 family protein
MADLEEQIQQLETSEEAVVEAPVETAEEETQAPENLAELEQKRNAINDDAEKHRRLRDDLNKQTKEWVAKRDALNAQVRELVEEAGKHRTQRDELNQKVRESKVLRDEANQKVSQLTEEYRALKSDMPAPDKNQPSVKQLKKEFSDLENKQQTQVLKKGEEEAIVKRLKELDAQINEIEKNQEQSGDLREKSSALRAAKEEAEKCHKLVSEYAEKAQAEHDEMIKLYEQADSLRKQADEAQAKFIECKKAADEEHKKHIEQIKSFHETDKDFAAIKNKQKAVRKKKTDAESKKAADDIFARFKSGDKLSTEDLMILQKSGYL